MNYNKAEFTTSYGRFEQIPPSDRPEIAFSGRSNVGKSSLINKLLNRKKLARVSSVPGKTATINFYSCENIFFVDLPGYGYANVSKAEKRKWKSLIGGYLNDTERQLDLVIQLIDMRHPPSKDDLQMIDFFIDSEVPFIIVFTKADKLKKTAREQRMASFADEIPCFEDITYIEFSAVTGEGVEELRELLDDLCDGAEITPAKPLSDASGSAEYVETEQESDDTVNPFGVFLTPNRK
ncbi:MAG: YihA family ribosome biogenesis GTP-binding protein [Ruminococcus sp.]|nr:YihA family ribosome biogenesis GTP-binding protein [Ruminococcus sp.]